MWGLRLEPAPVQRQELAVFYLWPDNWRTWELFLACSSQWVVSMGGCEGLHYPSVDLLLARSGLRPRQRREAWDCIVAMERACLEVWAEQRARRSLQ